LEQAEHLREEAEGLLEAATAGGTAVEELRAQSQAATARAASAEASLGRLEAEHAALLELLRKAAGESSVPKVTAGGTESSTSFFADIMIRMSQDAERLIEAAEEAAGRLQAQAGLELERAEADGAEILARARAEAEESLKAATAAITRDTAAAAAAREEAERARAIAAKARHEVEREREAASRARQEAETLLGLARDAATRMTDEVRAECIRLTEAAQAAALAEFSSIRHQFALDLEVLRDTMAMTLGVLDHFLVSDQSTALGSLEPRPM
jgi:hypothetical protein